MVFPYRVDEDIVLRLLSPSDADRFYALVDQNREHLSRWFSWVDRYESVSEAIAFAAGNLQRMAEHSGLTCLVWYRGQLAGLVDLLNIDRPRRQGEIGFWLGEAFQGHGIARRAVVALIEHAFTHLDFALIHARVRPENSRSLALLETFGFTSESRGDAVVCELTRDQWLATARDRG